MGTVADPRKEVLSASRFRSGSLHKEKSENLPPSLQPRQNDNKNDLSPRHRIPSDNLTNKPHSRGGLFGSNVSKIKEMFQTNAPVIKSDLHHQAPEVEKSPESKRKKTEIVSRMKHAPVVQSEHGLLDATNHVQRFMYTRALFARLEGTSQPQHQTDQIHPSNKGGATPSPVLSPNTSTPTSPTSNTGKHQEDHYIHSHRHSNESLKSKCESSDDSSNVPKGTISDQRPTSLNIHSRTNLNLYSNAPGGLLWKRRQNENSIANNLYSGSKRNEEEKMDVDDSKSDDQSDKYDFSVTSGYRSRSADSNKRSFHCDRIRSVSNDRGQSVSHSQGQKAHTSSSAEHSDDNTEVVMRRQRNNPTELGKRLSKEEIQAAIDKADNYLSHVGVRSDFQSKRRSWEIREQMSESTDTKVGGLSKLNQKSRSRSADTLDNDVVSDSSRNRTYTDRYRIRSNRRTSDTHDTNSSNIPDNNMEKSDNSRVYHWNDQSEVPTSKSSVPSKPPVPSKPSISRPDPVSRPTPSPRKPAPSVPQKTYNIGHIDSEKTDIVQKVSQDTDSQPSIESSESVPNTTDLEVDEQQLSCTIIESVSQKPTTPSSVQIEVVSSLLTDDLRPDTPQSTSSKASSPRDSPPPPPLSPPPPLPHVTKPQVDVDEDHVTSVITAAPNVLEDRPPPPPYPDEDREPPPPYCATSHHKVDEPPSPAPQPGIDELAHHPYESVSQFGVQMRTKFGAEISTPMEDDPPSPTVQLVKSMSVEQQSNPRSRAGIYVEEKKEDSGPVLSEEIPPREAGDGHEEPDSILNDTADIADYQKEEIIDYLEISGISSSDESDDDEFYHHPASKIKFSKEPIRVFPTFSTEEYDRRNEDVDPVAASAEYELEKRVEKMDVFPVDLQKGPEGLGLSIIGMGVGADSGLEKLGIFIKTLTEGGAAQRDSRIQVNDQIIEVDGKSLVGVTQAYAASVLRNTTGTVKFMIGREKDPSKSEVARLIQQSLEQDRRREEMKRLEHERLAQLQDSVKPRDEIMEREHRRHLSEPETGIVLDDDDDEEEDEEIDEEEDDISGEYQTSINHNGIEDEEEETSIAMETAEEIAAGEATPMSIPSSNDNSVGSPDEDRKPVVEVFDLHESSSEDVSPDMESQAMFIKLKEAQYKNAVNEAEIAKLKAKLIQLESVQNEKKEYQKKSEDMAHRLREVEKKLMANRKEINQYQDLLEGSQGQYIALEKKMKGDFTALEKKYHKAKKLIKEYQSREKDFLQERESLLQQQAEKDQQYNSLVKSLKDRIFQLEGELGEAQKAAGLPILIPDPSQRVPEVITKESSVKVESALGTVLTQSQMSDVVSISSGSDDSPGDTVVSQNLDISTISDIDSQLSKSFNEVLSDADLLDSSASKSKSQLVSSGVMGRRRPPTKRNKSTDEEDMETEVKQETQSGLETWIRHDGDGTVKKNDAKKRKAQLIPESMITDHLEEPPSIPPPPPPPMGADSDSVSQSSSRRNSQSEQSETASTVSQTSYDPSNPNFRNMESEIPDTVSIDTTGSSDGASSSSKSKSSSSKGLGLSKFLKFGKGSSSSDSSGGGGIVLLSNKSLNGEDAGGIKLISKRPLEATYSSESLDGLDDGEDISSAYMVQEIDDEDGKKTIFTLNIAGTPAAEENSTTPSRRNINQIESCPISEWKMEHIRNWLVALEQEKYIPMFAEKHMTGLQLVSLDGTKLKNMGMTVSKDREIFKKKIKELKMALEKEKKQQEKERKIKEKEQKKQRKK